MQGPEMRRLLVGLVTSLMLALGMAGSASANPKLLLYPLKVNLHFADASGKVHTLVTTSMVQKVELSGCPDPGPIGAHDFVAYNAPELSGMAYLGATCHGAKFPSRVPKSAGTKPPAEGGWNCLNTRLSGLDNSNPASIGLRGNGLKGWFGWPDAPKFVSLREQWFDAPDLAAQQKITREEQLAAFEVVPYVPLGQWAQPTAFRSDLTGFLRSPNPLFWNVRRG